jgi:GT2 family glycosyltransferase
MRSGVARNASYRSTHFILNHRTMALPFISVIIPTYGREAPLVKSIEDVLKQDYPQFEVLVVDQTPTHEPAVQAFLETEVMLFLDDDVELPDGFLTAHGQNYARPEVGAVAGRVLDRMKLNDFKAGLEIATLPPEAMDPAIAWYHINLVHTTQPQQVLSARGCNMSYRREIFVKHDIWFDERFRGSAIREESDFCLHLRETGLIVWYDPSADLVHLGEETGGCHDITTKSLKYQMTFYHNHFLMGLKHLTFWQCCRFFLRLFDCHVLGRPPCHKSGSPIKVATRFVFYTAGFGDAVWTQIKGLWDDGQAYTKRDRAVDADGDGPIGLATGVTS